MENLTEKEKIVMQAFIEDEFYEHGLESILRADVFSDNLQNRGFNARTRSGVLSSLNKKRLLNFQFWIMLTEKGKEYIKTTFNITE